MFHLDADAGLPAADSTVHVQTLQAYPQFQIIPHRLTVAKRLAQCLNPALPTGVHQRALDVYVYILNTIGVRMSLSLPDLG